MQSSNFETVQPQEARAVQDAAGMPAQQDLITSLYSEVPLLSSRNVSSSVLPDLKIEGTDDSKSGKLPKNGAGDVEKNGFDSRKPEDQEAVKPLDRSAEKIMPTDRLKTGAGSDQLKPENKAQEGAEKQPQQNIKAEDANHGRQSIDRPGQQPEQPADHQPKNQDLEPRRSSSPTTAEQHKPEASDQGSAAGAQSKTGVDNQLK